MGFSRFHLPTDYLAEREKHGLGLPAGAVQLGEFTVTLEPPPDLLEYIDKNTPKEEGGALPMLTHEQIATHVDEDHGICECSWNGAGFRCRSQPASVHWHARRHAHSPACYPNGSRPDADAVALQGS